jgi:antirestriction protein ArdC
MNGKNESLDNTNENNIKEALQRIEHGLENINTNEEWLKLLSFQSRFHNYSFHNTVMLYLQLPAASHVAGYNHWKSFGRFVKKGEKSLKIFAPLLYKVKSEKVESTDDKYNLKGFKLVSVFDLSQTDGDDSKIPVVIGGLKGNSEDLNQLYYSLIEKFIIDVQERTDIKAKGTYDIIKKVITIKSGMPYQQKLKTLIHEFAHHIQHTCHFNTESRDLEEIIAESTSYIVCSYLGINSDDYSFPYIKSWCKDIKQLKLVGDTIQKIASKIITLTNTEPLETDKTADKEAS